MSLRRDEAVPSIRPARASDIDAIAAVQRASIVGLAAGAYGPERAAAWADETLRHAPTLLDGATFFVAEERGGRVVAVAGWSPHAERLGVVWVRSVFVHPDLAGRGLGRRLMTAIEASARRAGATEFMVRSSLNAVGFYGALGYAEVENLAGLPPSRSGAAHPCVLMTKGASAGRSGDGA